MYYQKNEFNICQRNRNQLFVDLTLMKYRIEFIINCAGSIKYEDWSQAKSLDQFAPHVQIADTLFLLTQDGYHGFPIVVSPYENEDILLNNGNNISLRQMQQDYKNKKIPTGIALDFNGIETLINKTGLHEQFDPITQQLAKLSNIKSLNMQGFLAGQYVLLDFNSSWLLLIYVLNNLYIRTQRRIVHVQDLQMYHDSFYQNGEFINKNYIQLEYNYIQLSSQEDSDEKDNNNKNKNNNNGSFNLPGLNNKQGNNQTHTQALTTHHQAQAIQSAIANANNKVSDKQQFSKQNEQQQQQKQQDKTVPPLPHHQQQRVDPQVVWEMNVIERKNFLLEKLHARVSLYDAKITDCVPHLLEYDLSYLIAALNDDTDTYIINLVSKLHEQLKYRRTWTLEQKRDFPFWYNPKNLTEAQRKDSSKNEIENDETDLAVELSLDLEVIPTEFAKKAFLGTKLYPILSKNYPNQAHKLYTNCMKFEINHIQNAICDVKKLDELVTKAQLIIQYQENNDYKSEMNMNVEMADEKKKDVQNKSDEESNNEDGQEDDIEIDITVNSNKNGNENENENGNEWKDNYDREKYANFDPSNFEKDKVEEQLYNPNMSSYENEKMREMSFKMLDSWNDRIYSHLRTFRNYQPTFSNKDKLYDHSTRTLVKGVIEKFFYDNIWFQKIFGTTHHTQR